MSIQSTGMGKDEARSARLTLTITEAGQMAGLGRSAAYQAAKTGEMPVIRIGGRLLVSRAAWEKKLNGEG